MNIKFHRVLQITDCHLFADKNKHFLGMNTFESLRYVIDLVKRDIKKSKPEYIVFTGDISQDGSIASYEHFVSCVKDINIPMRWLPGNHDHVEHGEKVLQTNNVHLEKIIEIEHWKLILLNSKHPGHISGFLSEDELSFLSQELCHSKDKQIAIFVHHHPVPMNCKWLDQHSLQNADQFLNYLLPYNNIHAVVFGHVHSDNAMKKNNIQFMSAPSTSFQFDVAMNQFKLDSVMPGYRQIDLYDDGNLQTDVVRIDFNEHLLPDLASKGY